MHTQACKHTHQIKWASIITPTNKHGALDFIQPKQLDQRLVSQPISRKIPVQLRLCSHQTGPVGKHRSGSLSQILICLTTAHLSDKHVGVCLVEETPDRHVGKSVEFTRCEKSIYQVMSGRHKISARGS